MRKGGESQADALVWFMVVMKKLGIHRGSYRVFLNTKDGGVTLYTVRNQ